MTANKSPMRSRTEPRRGDRVRVRSREEILASLDPNGSINSLPFMPEMLDFAGQELTVWSRADKSCDVAQSTGNRRMEKTVHLLESRCSGEAHGGCQAGCLLFWRQEWLEWTNEPGRPISAPAGDGASGVTEETLRAATQVVPGENNPYVCQATEHFRASSPMPRRNYLQYVHDVRIRNVTARAMVRGLVILVVKRYQWLSRRFPKWLRIRDGRTYPFIVPTGTGERIPAVDLHPGDLVEVRSKEEILATLGPDQRNRNMHFDEEMLPYCGRRARVVKKVTQILDETSGKMINLSDCYVLEDVICLGLYKRFCQRAITPYWRSGWLRKVDESAGVSPRLPGQALPRRRS
jgi:hypothetical protein